MLPRSRRLLALVVLLAVGCGKRQPRSAAREAVRTPAHRLLVGAHVVGLGPREVEVQDGVIVGVGLPGTLGKTGSPTRVELTGRWLAPGFIDSHVHLAYLPVADTLAARGVVAAVDLAAPLGRLPVTGALRVFNAGPMLTAPGGYPLNTWGRDGYGVPVRDPAGARAAVDRVHDGGAQLLKVPLGEPPVMDDATLTAVLTRAKERSLRVAAHALDDAGALRAARAGVDLLAHTPVEPLSDETVSALEGRVVISTLAAFGGAPSTLENLRRLRAAGAIVLYGTDLGNTQDARISSEELALLQAAGLSPAEIFAAGTLAPAAYWGWTDLGAIAPGKAALLLVAPRDPLIDPLALAEASTLR